MTWFDTEDRARLLRLAAGFIETGNYWFRYHVQKMGEDADDLARRLFDFAEELESGRLRPGSWTTAPEPLGVRDDQGA